MASNSNEWWIDSSATRYVYSKKEIFIIFEPIKDEDKLFTENSAIFIVEG